MARRALHIDAQEDLADRLRELHLPHLARIHIATPLDAIDKALALTARSHQFPRELIEALVAHQRLIQPVRDLLPPTVDVTRAHIVIAQQIIPHRQPVLRVVHVPRKHRRDHLRALVRTAIRQEALHHRRRRGQSDQVQVHPAQKSRVISRLGARLLVRRQIRVDDPVDRVRPPRHRRRQRHHARLQRRLIATLAKGKALLPGQPLRHPPAQRLDLCGRHPRPLWRHLRLFIRRRQHLQQQALVRLGQVHDCAILRALQQVLPRVHAQPALLLLPQVALRAVLLQDRHHLMREINSRRSRQRGKERKAEKGTKHGARPNDA